MGMSRGGIGGGAGLVGVLLAAQVLPPIQAAALLLPILVITDPISIWLYRKNIDWQSLKVLLPGVALGLFIAYFTVYHRAFYTRARIWLCASGLSRNCRFCV